MKNLLRFKQFRRLLGAWTIGNFADSALFLTLAVWAKDLTRSSGAAGMVFFCLGAPVLAAPVLGLLADRTRRRPLLIWGNLLSALLVLGLFAVRVPSDNWLLYAVTVGYGALGVLNGAAQSGLLRTMLDDERLGPANAMFMTIDQGMRIVTPLVGAGLYTLWGGRMLAAGTAIMLVVTAVGLALVRVVEPRPARARGRRVAGSDADAPVNRAVAGPGADPGQDLDTDGSGDATDLAGDSGWRALSAGFAHVRRTIVVRDIVIGLALALSVIGLFDSLLFAVIEHSLHRPPAFFGVLASAQGAGAILGGLTAVRLLDRCGPARAVAVALLVLAVGVAPLLTASVALVLVGMSMAGIAIPWAFVAMVTTRQQLTPADLQGRAASATALFLQVPQLASTATGAAVVAFVDYRVLTVIAVAVIICAAWWLLTRSTPQYRRAASRRRATPPRRSAHRPAAAAPSGLQD